MQLKFIYHSLNITKIFYFLSSNFKNDTIYALSSGTNTAISVIRVCGPQADKVLNLTKASCSQHNLHSINASDCATKSNGSAISKKLKPRVMYLKKFYNQSSQLIDEGLLVYFPESHSYNLQQIYELHLHGSRAVVAAIFKEFQRLGMRLAQRGEFTKRAVLNGKLGFYQAEAINDLVKSDTEFQRQVAINHLLGKNTDFLMKLKADLVSCLAKNEAYLDFEDSESDVQGTLFEETKIFTANIIRDLEKVLKNYRTLQLVKSGIDIGIIGKPNVGKSALMNCLTNNETSIVSDLPGTTRDTVKYSIECDGYLLNLIDTAGLRHSQCIIQQEGVRRAKQNQPVLVIQLAKAIYRLQQLTGLNNSITFKTINCVLMCILNQQVWNSNDALLVVNKSDLLPDNISRAIIAYKGRIYADCILISASKEQKIGVLQVRLSKLLNERYPIFKQNNQEIYFTRERYFKHLQNVKQLLEEYIKTNQPDIACEYVREAVNEVGNVFGHIDSEDVLNVLFQDFCIGK